MDKKMSKNSPSKDPERESRYDTDTDMEVDENIPRWSIPRPSLSSCSGGSRGSGGSSISSQGQGGCGGSRGGCKRGGCHSREGGKHCRSSSSSQGSSSNNSTQSASSGSLLLSAVNLAQVDSHYPPSRLSQSSLTNYKSNLNNYVSSGRSPSCCDQDKISHIEVAIEPSTDANQQLHSDPFWSHVKLASAKNQRRDLRETESIASSTHFTVVNGFTRHGRNIKNEKQMWCCKSSHQITVLVITMTIIFTAGILAAICYIEMRQRRDTGSRFS